MASYHLHLVLALSALLVLLPSASAGNQPLGAKGKGKYEDMINHGGTMFSKDVNLYLYWYGQFLNDTQKCPIRNFIESLNCIDKSNKNQPRVSDWWNVVESYQSIQWKSQSWGRINVKIKQECADPNYASGKILNCDHIPKMVTKAGFKPDPKANNIFVVFADKYVTVHSLCLHEICQLHELTKDNCKMPYIIVADPEIHCPGQCAWPFKPADFGPKMKPVCPPSGDVATDAMIIALAQGLAETVVNPNITTGFFKGHFTKRCEIASICKGIFGRGATHDCIGKVQVDKGGKGGTYNIYGKNDKKYLLSSVWDPKANNCWTPC